MQKSKFRHLRYANVTATLALVFAMSGGALAASHYLISSTKQISPSVLKKLKGANGKPGAAGKEGAPGPQGNQGLQGKEGAAGKEGVAGVIRWRTTIAAAGASEAAPATVVLAKVGPFTVTGHCYVNTTKTAGATYIETSEKGSYAEGYSGRGSEAALEVEKPVQISDLTAEGLTASHVAAFTSADDGSWGGQTANGSLAFNGFASQGVWLSGESGPACSFSGYVVTE